MDLGYEPKDLAGDVDDGIQIEEEDPDALDTDYEEDDPDGLFADREEDSDSKCPFGVYCQEGVPESPADCDTPM